MQSLPLPTLESKVRHIDCIGFEADIAAVASSVLKELSVALGLLSSDHSPVADASGWKGYVWQVYNVAPCKTKGKSCLDAHGRWDWKRDQHFTFSYLIDPGENRITVTLGLDNRDPSDKDNVCIAAVFSDAKDQDVAVFFQRWPARPGKPYKRDVPLLPSRSVEIISQVAIGSKQCDGGTKEDAATFYQLRRELQQR